MSILARFLDISDTVLLGVLCFLLAWRRFRPYPLFAIFIILRLIGDILEEVALFKFGYRSPAYRQVYWTDHLALDLLLFLVLITLTYQAVGESPLRPKVGKFLTLVGVVTIALPFMMLRDHYGKRYGFLTSQWFNHVSQILSFGAGIINLFLWGALLSNRKRDSKLVIMSIGFGLVTASAALAWGTRQFLSQEARGPVDSFMTLSHLGAMAVWCWAFRPKAGPKPTSPVPQSATPPSAPPADALTLPS